MAVGWNVPLSAAARLPDCDRPQWLWEAVKARQHSILFGATSTKHNHDDTCQTQASTQCLLWRLKRFFCACKYELFQFNALIYLVYSGTEQLHCWVKIRSLAGPLEGSSGVQLVVNTQYLYPCRHVLTGALTMTPFSVERILIWLCRNSLGQIRSKM